MDLEARLTQLADNLDELDPDTPVSWSLAEAYNNLLDETKRALPDDAVVSAFEPARPSTTGRVAMGKTYGMLRVEALQLATAVRGELLEPPE